MDMVVVVVVAVGGQKGVSTEPLPCLLHVPEISDMNESRLNFVLQPYPHSII